MSTEANKALVRRFYDEVINGRKLEVLNEILDPNFEGFKVEGEDRVRDRADFKAIMAMVLDAFADYHQTIHDWIAEGDKVVARWSIRGTHTGTYVNIPATGKQIKTTGIDIFRVAGNTIREHWAEMDYYGTLQQMGVLPAEEQSEE
jgi:steroid delta-isomerase-like uncharacterized protein